MKTKIILERLIIKNFKGIKYLVIEFDEEVTNIIGDNGTGKTTVNDAFRWLQFDKDSSDRSQFSIKPLDENNNPTHGLDYSVTGFYNINGKSKIFKKVLNEKWVKKRGETESQFTGHETNYYIDDVPVKAGEYQEEINNIIAENLFKLLTDPMYFSAVLPWTERRTILLPLIGNITTTDVINSNENLRGLLDLLDGGKTVQKLKDSISAKKKKFNEDIEKIPTRIDECNNSILPVDVKSLKKELDDKQTSLVLVEAQLETFPKPDAEKIKKLTDLQTKISAIEIDADEKKALKERTHRNALRTKKTELQNLEQDLKNFDAKLPKEKIRKEELKKEVAKLENDWDLEDEKVFVVDNNFICPTCKRKLDQNIIETKKIELEGNFNQQKAKNLSKITEEGKATKNEIANIDTWIMGRDKIVTEIESKKLEVENTQAVLDNIVPDYGDEYQALKEEYDLLKKEAEPRSNIKVEIDKLKVRKTELNDEIDSVKTKLLQEETNKRMKIRIKELEAEERKLAQDIADLEKQEFLCEDFFKVEAELIEEKVNGLFQIVKFKMFETQINGGIKPTCQPLINGVPFVDANNASKINAGIDIINILSDHYGITAPIFIDNREAVNKIIPTDSQIINLIVTKDKSLKVA